MTENLTTWNTSSGIIISHSYWHYQATRHMTVSVKTWNNPNNATTKSFSCFMDDQKHTYTYENISLLFVSLFLPFIPTKSRFSSSCRVHCGLQAAAEVLSRKRSCTDVGDLTPRRSYNNDSDNLSNSRNLYSNILTLQSPWCCRRYVTCK